MSTCFVVVLHRHNSVGAVMAVLMLLMMKNMRFLLDLNLTCTISPLNPLAKVYASVSSLSKPETAFGTASASASASAPAPADEFITKVFDTSVIALWSGTTPTSRNDDETC